MGITLAVVIVGVLIASYLKEKALDPMLAKA